MTMAYNEDEARGSDGRWTAGGAAVESATTRAMRDLPASADRGAVRDAISRSLGAVNAHVARLGRTVLSVVPRKIVPVRGGGIQAEFHHRLDDGSVVVHQHQMMPQPLDATAGALGAAALGASRYGSKLAGVGRYAPAAATALGAAGGISEGAALGVRGLHAALTRAGYREVPPAADQVVRKSASSTTSIAKGFNESGEDANKRWLGRQGVSGRFYG